MSVYEKRSVQNLPLYKAARTLEAVSREYNLKKEEIIKLAGNENRFGCSPKVAEALEKNKGNFSYYPDMNATVLREKLSEKYNVPADWFVFGNGSFELISLGCAAFINRGDEAIYNDPSFGWYVNVTRQNEGVLVTVPVNEKKAVDTDKISEKITDKTKVIWLCNPNNPTGTVLPYETLKKFIEGIPEKVLIVLDEAYIEYIEEDYPDTIDFVRNHKNVIILRTFSKAYGLASFRIGYGIAGPEIIDSINKVRLPINVSYASQTAAVAALSDNEFTEFIIETNRKERIYYYEEFEKLGLEYIRSNGNFILVNIAADSSQAERKFTENGIVIRNGEEFGLPGWLRISVGKPEENRKVIEVLKKIKEELT